MTTVMPKIEATGDESLLEVVPAASILGTHQPIVDPEPLTPPPSSPVEVPSSPADKPQPYASLFQTKVEHFLNNPRTMMGVKFICSPPNTENAGLQGEWTLEAHAIRIGDDDTVDEEYEVRLAASPDALMTLSRDEVQYLLKFSHVS